MKMALAFSEMRATYDDLHDYIDTIDAKDHALGIIPFAAPLASAAMTFVISKIPQALAYAKEIGAKKVKAYLGNELGDKIMESGEALIKKGAKKLIKKFEKKGAPKEELKSMADELMKVDKLKKALAQAEEDGKPDDQIKKIARKLKQALKRRTEKPISKPVNNSN
jgi:hypothetical protein